MSRDPVDDGAPGMQRWMWRLSQLDAGTILMTLLVLGLALRAFIAGVYLPLSGFSIDIADFTLWAQRLASIGP
ncbi:MAG TPA: hypothetical protein VMM85_05825, partial [Methylomirabilota bacterium]|nr:hypothetical protein [Methylomirabilota bacterium]